MGKTLLEKLDAGCRTISLKQSVCNQVQRIISSRTYLGRKPKVGSYVTGFGVPEVVETHAASSEDMKQFTKLVCQQILALEPRVKSVELTTYTNSHYRSSCQLRLQLKDCQLEEEFFF